MYQASQSPAARQPSNDYWQQAQQTNYDTFAPSYGEGLWCHRMTLFVIDVACVATWNYPFQ